MLLLPCGIGDTVYANNSTFGILPYTVDCIVVEKDSIVFQCSSYSYYECLDEIEKTVFDFGRGRLNERNCCCKFSGKL